MVSFVYIHITHASVAPNSQNTLLCISHKLANTSQVVVCVSHQTLRFFLFFPPPRPLCTFMKYSTAPVIMSVHLTPESGCWNWALLRVFISSRRSGSLLQRSSAPSLRSARPFSPHSTLQSPATYTNLALFATLHWLCVCDHAAQTIQLAFCVKTP